MKKLMKRHGQPRNITTDGLRSYKATLMDIGNADRKEFDRWANNWAENSHLPSRRRARAMLGFRSMKTLQKFASVHNHFSHKRQLINRNLYIERRLAALAEGYTVMK